MSFRLFLPSLLHSGPTGTAAAPLRRLPLSPTARCLHSPARPVALTIPHSTPKSSFSLYALTAGLGLSAYTLTRPPVLCDTSRAAPVPQRRPDAPPESVLNVYQLGFGTVCGICTGVFVKKGLRAIAFFLGGLFVLMQYLSSRSFITVDWGRLAGRYDSAFGTLTAEGGTKSPTVAAAWQWLVDFVTANFQQRASFIAGLVLGIRLG